MTDTDLPRWSVLIVDDEPAARRGVRQLLVPYPDFVVAGECRNGAELLAALERTPVDLVFLDIQMPGLDGFEAIRRRTPERMPVVVFLTAFDNHALRAFEVQAFDYLVKPVTEARFGQTIRRLRHSRRAPRTSPTPVTLVVPTSRGARVVSLLDVDWIEAADNYVRLWMGGRSLLVREAMRSLEARARSCGFRRVHRSALVRLDLVAGIDTLPSGESWVVLHSNTRVPLARRRRTAFLRVLRARSTH